MAAIVPIMEDLKRPQRFPDVLTVASIAVVAYALSNVVHEGLGHGGACLLVGCTPHVLTSMQFDGDYAQLPEAAARIIFAGGSAANLVVAAVAITLLRKFRKTLATTWFFLWLLATVCLFQTTGYLMFSGVANIGDWAEVVRGWPGSALWRVVMVAAGGLTYWVATRWAIAALGARLQTPAPARVSEAYRYTLVAYLTGAILFVLAGSRDPGGVAIVLVSSIAASLGATSGLLWGPQLLKDSKLGPATNPPPPLVRDWRWVAAAAVIGALFVFVLGSGIRL